MAQNMPADNSMDADSGDDTSGSSAGGVYEAGGGYDYPSSLPDLPTQPVPDYRSGVFSPANGRDQEWEDWNDVLLSDPGLSPTERKVFADIYAAEGGMTPNGGTVAGIDQDDIDAASTLKAAIQSIADNPDGSVVNKFLDRLGRIRSASPLNGPGDYERTRYYESQ